MNRIGKITGTLVLSLSTLVGAAGARHSVHLDTQGRLGYSLSVSEWLDAGLAGTLDYRGRSTWRPNAGNGEILGSVESFVNYGLLLPVIDFHPAWSGMEAGCRTYLSIHDPGPASDIIGEWVRSDLYLAYPIAFDRLEVTPSAYLLKYGYLLGEKFHEFGYGLLLEGRIAFRF